MHAFQRAAHSRRHLRIPSEKRRTLLYEEGPQPLAPVESAMPHGREQRRGAGDFVGQAVAGKQGDQKRFRPLGTLAQMLFEVRGRYRHPGCLARVVGNFNAAALLARNFRSIRLGQSLAFGSAKR